MTWDTPDWRMDRDAKLREWMLGNEDACAILRQVSHIAEVWDDLVDGDKMPEQGAVTHAFEAAMVRLQTNRLFMANHAMFIGVIVLSINAWHDSNAWQHETGWKRHQAFFLRNLGIELAMLCAFVVGGYDHMRGVSLAMREFFHHENYEEWQP